MAQQQNQRADPGEFGGIDTDYRDCVSHRKSLSYYLFGQRAENCER